MKSIQLWMATFLLGALVTAGGIALGHSLGSEAEALAAAEFDAEVARQDADAAKQDAKAAEQDAQVARQEAEAAKAVLTEAKTKLAGYEAPIYREFDDIYRDNARIKARVYLNTDYLTGLPFYESTLAVHADNILTSSRNALTLEIRCNGGDRHFRLTGVTIPSRTDDDVYDESYSVIYRALPTPDQIPDRVSISAAQAVTLDRTNVIYLYATPFMYSLTREAESLEVLIEGANGESVSTTFSMDGVWDTPITPNLDRCGDYHYYSPTSILWADH